MSFWTKAPTITCKPRGDKEIVITREFDATPELLFRAHTEPDLLRVWMGGIPGWTFAQIDVDLRVGGKYRFVMKSDEGHEMGWGGSYQEIKRPEKIVNTELFDEAWYDGESIVQLTFKKTGAKTLLMMELFFASHKAREQAIQSPMTDGMELNYAALDKLAF